MWLWLDTPSEAPARPFHPRRNFSVSEGPLRKISAQTNKISTYACRAIRLSNLGMLEQCTVYCFKVNLTVAITHSLIRFYLPCLALASLPFLWLFILRCFSEPHEVQCGIQDAILRWKRRPKYNTGILLEQPCCCRHLNNEIVLWICQLRTLNIRKEMLICFGGAPYLWTFGSSLWKDAHRLKVECVWFTSRDGVDTSVWWDLPQCGPKHVSTTLPWHRQEAVKHLRGLSPFPRGMWRTSAFPPLQGMCCVTRGNPSGSQMKGSFVSTSAF